MKPTTRSLYVSLLLFIGLPFLEGCTVEESTLVLEPGVITYSASSVTKNSATVSAEVLGDGNGEILQRGVVYSESPNPTINLATKALVVGGVGSFSADISGLKPNTKYYANGFATNSKGTGYGFEISFTTSDLQPASVLTFTPASSITATSASVSGEVLNQGDATVTERGIVYKTSASPTTADSKVMAGSGTGSFTASLTGLSPGTTYYAKAYAVTSVGTSYGAQMSFATTALQNLALQFDGTNDYVSIPQSSLSTTITIEAWVYWEGSTSTGDATSNWQRVFDFNNFTGSYMFFSTRKNGDFFPRFGIKAPGGAEQFLTGKYRWSTNRWHHVAVVLNGSTGRLYIDGVEEDSKAMTYTGSSLGSLPNFWLGRSAFGDPYFKGRIDDVRIWNTARSASQIATNMKVNLTGSEAGLVSFYRFETTATANGANSGITTLTNQVATGTSGVLNGFSLTGSLSNWTDNVSFPESFVIGQAYGGGKIAYLDATGLHGFVVTTSHQNGGSGIVWTPSSTNIPTSTGINSGMANTILIVNAFPSGPSAAKICSDLVLNGFDDWYLPSKDQLTAMAPHHSILGLTSFIWSSSQESVDWAWHQNPPSGITIQVKTTATLTKVRAVRSF